MTAPIIENPVTGTSEPDRCWTLTNVSEACPLVLTALEWSIWGQAVELGSRGAWADFGFLPPEAVVRSEDQNDWITGCFYGRQALNLDLTREIMGMIPGSSADDFERDMLGSVRADAKPVPDSLARLPAILWKAPRILLTQARAVRELNEGQLAWWRRVVLDEANPDPLALLEQSTERFTSAMRVHVRSRTLLQGFQAQVMDLAEAAGLQDRAAGVLSGYGDVAETAIAEDLWDVGRGTLSVQDFIRHHGFHGPNEGNPRVHSWREDDAAIVRAAKALAGRPDEEHPRLREARTVAAREAAEAELLARLPLAKRLTAPMVLKGAGAQVRNLELGKAAFVAAIDGCRRAARDLGAALAGRGVLRDPDDVWHLTRDELRQPEGRDELVAARREDHERFEAGEIPVTFTGMPTLTVADAEDPVTAGPADPEVRGVCGAPGAVSGRAVVVTDPATADFGEGDVLVCRLTDPGWAPVFTLAAGLVIDIGGPASHGAIVARELGVPCVIGTGDGTSRIRTGDLVEVDGTRGLVTITR